MDDFSFLAGCYMGKMRQHRPRDALPTVAEPRRPLLLGAYSFVRAARLCRGVRRIALLGSLATAKAIPKDVDLLVTIEWAMDLTQLARAGRRLKGLAQTINLGADIFLADTAGITLVVSAIIANAVHVSRAVHSIAGLECISTTIFNS
jgi:predicted nucleotidyltransferase